MPTPEHLQILWDLSDETLYSEAVSFLHRLIKKEGCMPLPAAQVAGLLNIANASSFSELHRFIRHQRERNWPESKQDIKIFYTELEKQFSTMTDQWIVQKFHFAQAGQNNKETARETDELRALLAREFIQHLVTENMLLARR